MHIVNQPTNNTLEYVKLPSIPFILMYSKAMKVIQTEKLQFEILIN